MNIIVIKNILLHLLIIPFYFLSVKEIAPMPVERLDTLLLFVGLIVIAPITSNFIYSYKNASSKKGRFYGHFTTFFSMLVIGMLFTILDVLLLNMIGNVIIFRISILLFWLAVITFDFADWYTRDE